MSLPSQEEAEQATEQGMKEGEGAIKDANSSTQQKKTWSSYVSNAAWTAVQRGGNTGAQQETEQQRDSRTWASYFPSGKGFSNYVPSVAKDAASAFAGAVRLYVYYKFV